MAPPTTTRRRQRRPAAPPPAEPRPTVGPVELEDRRRAGEEDREARTGRRGLARTRRRLRLAAVLCLLAVPVETVLLLVVDAQTGDTRGVLFDVAELWIPWLPVLLVLAAAVLLVGAVAVRLLPGGATAAREVPLWPRKDQRGGARHVGAVIAALAMLGFGVGLGYVGVTGTGAALGAGRTVTRGVDAFDGGSTDYGRHPTHYLLVDDERVVAEPGSGHDGSRFGRWPSGAGHVWRHSVGGVLEAGVLALLGTGLTVGAVLVVRGVRRARRAHPVPSYPPDSGTLVTAAVVLAAVTAAGLLLRHDVAGRDDRAARVELAPLRGLGIDPVVKVSDDAPDRGDAVLSRYVGHIFHDEVSDLRPLDLVELDRYPDAAAAAAGAGPDDVVRGRVVLRSRGDSRVDAVLLDEADRLLDAHIPWWH